MILNETILAKPIIEEISREKLPEGVLCRISYPICDIDKRNANGRVYEDAVWDRVHKEKDLKEKLDNRALFGHAEHPEQTQSNLEKTSHVIFEMWKENGQEWQKFDVVDTPTGRIVDTLLRAGCQVGVSTRAEGDLEEAEDDEGTYQRVVPESYNYVTTDFTADPSTFGALPHDIKRNVVSDVKKELENKEVNGSEREFAVLLLESMKCKKALIAKCKKCGCCEALKEAKKVREKKYIMEGTWALPSTEKKAQELSDLLENPISFTNLHGKMWNLYGTDAVYDELDALQEDILPSAVEIARKHLKHTLEAYEANPESFKTKFDDKAFEVLKGIVVEQRTLESLIKDRTIKAGTKVRYGDKDAKVEKIEEGTVSLTTSSSEGGESPPSISVDVRGNAQVSVDSEAGTVHIIPASSLMEPEVPDVKAVEEPPTIPPGEEATAVIVPGDRPEEDPGEEVPESIKVGATVEFDKIDEGKLGVVLTGADIGQKERKPKYFDTEEEAKAYAKRMNAQLSKGEKEYYKLRYKTVEGKVTKIEEGAISISLDDGTVVSIEDPTAVNITVTAPPPKEEIEPVGPPEEEIEDMEAAGPLPIKGEVPESKVDERRWKVIFIDKHGEKDQTTVTAPSKRHAEKWLLKYSPEIDIKDTVEVSESKVEETEDVFAKHGINICIKTLKMSDAGAEIMGPPTKEEAREVLRKHGWSDERIAELEESKVEERVYDKGDEITHQGRIGNVVAKGGAPTSYKVHFKDTDKDEWIDLGESKVDEKELELKDAIPILDFAAYKLFKKTGESCSPEEYEEVKAYVRDYLRWREEEKVEESEVNETEDIKAMYKAAGLPAPDGKGIHTKAFHELAIEVAKGYVKSGDAPQEALDKAYPTAMKQLGKEKAVKKPHQKSESKIQEGLESHANRILGSVGFTYGEDYGWDKGSIVVYEKGDTEKIMKALDDSGEFGPTSSDEKTGKISFGEYKNESKVDEKISSSEITDVVYDTLMKNTQHPQLDLKNVKDQEVDGGKGLIRFTYEDTPVNININTSEKEPVESISTTAKEMIDLKVKEAFTRSERDKALELLEDFVDEKKQLLDESRKSKSLEARILISKIREISEADERELDAVRSKLEEKAKLVSELKEEIERKNKFTDELKEKISEIEIKAASSIKDLEESIKVNEEKQQLEIAQLENKHNENIEQLKVDYNKKISEEVEKVKKEVKEEFIKSFVAFKLSETRLKVDENSQALLESCKSFEEVDDVLDEILDTTRRSALHSDPIDGIKISKPRVDPEQVAAERAVGNVFEGMNGV